MVFLSLCCDLFVPLPYRVLSTEHSFAAAPHGPLAAFQRTTEITPHVFQLHQQCTSFITANFWTGN